VKIVVKSSAFFSDFLANDSLVPAFVFYRQRQTAFGTCLHKTSLLLLKYETAGFLIQGDEIDEEGMRFTPMREFIVS
jgi:hypothetical protein